MKGRTPLIVLLVAGLIARVTVAVITGNSFQFPDEAVYADAAHRLTSGQGFWQTYTRVPGYPVFLAALAFPFPWSVVLLRVGQALVTAAGVVLVYAFVAAFIGRGPALPAALLYAADPLLVAAAALLYPEAVAAMLMIGVPLAAMTAARRNAMVFTVLAGCLLGVLVQLRPVALVLTPVLGAWLYFATGAGSARRLAHAAALVLACLLMLLPWTLRNYGVYGDLMPIATAGTRAGTVEPADSVQRGLTASIVARAISAPGDFVKKVGNEFLHFWEPYPTRLATDNPQLRTAMREREPRLSGAPLFGKNTRDALSAISFGFEMVLAAVGVAVAWRTHRREAVLLIMLVLAFALGYTMFIAKLRYRIPVLPLVFAFAGIGAHTLWQRVAVRVRARSPQVVSA